MKIARGAYIIFLDADDLLSTDCLKQRLSSINIFPDHKFWVFPIGTFYKVKGDHNSIWMPKGTDFLIRFLKHNLPWHTMSVAWSKNYIKALNGFDTDYQRLQDVELHTRALLGKVSFKTFPKNKVDAFYRIDEQRTTQNLEQKLTKQMNGVVLYLEKTSILLNTNIEKKAIKGTLFGFLTSLNYHCFILSNELELHKKIFDSLTVSIDNLAIFKKNDLRFLNFYSKYYKNGFWKLKGYNYLMKSIFLKL